MAIYRCSRCNQLIDDDYEPGEEDPEDGCELICPGCFEDIEGEDDGLELGTGDNTSSRRTSASD